MQSCFLSVLFAVSTVGYSQRTGNPPPGAAESFSMTGTNTEVVIAPRAPAAVRFAACEATNFLSRVLGRAVPVVTAPTVGKFPIILGANSWNDAAGMTTNGLVRDAFRVRIGSDAVRIIGIDDPSMAAVPAAGPKTDMPVGFSETERATLFGVYEFLERYAQVRMYFPGELGEIVQRRDAIDLSPTEFSSAPEFIVRNVYMQGDGAWYEPEGADPHTRKNARKALSWARLRLQTQYIPCCHGQCRNGFLQRFGKTNPEYFALLKGPDGKLHRDCEPLMRKNYKSPSYYYLCQSSSGMWDALYDDAVRYFRDRDAKIARYGHVRGGKFIDVMCEDGFRRCQCEACKAAYDDSHPRRQYATELVWNQTIKLANRLKAAGIPGYVTQMAYSPYHDLPKADIPDNLLVMVAEQGPWSNGNAKKRARDDAEIRAWAEKCGHKVWIWNYITKWGRLEMPGVPQMTPRAIGSYYPAQAPYIFGAFAESGSDKAIYQYLNYYVFAKVCWNTKTDVEALLEEHFRLMFGPAAPEMAAFYASLEDKWVNRIAANTVDSPTGPVSVTPNARELWMDIYSKKEISAYDALLERALSKVPADSLEAKRLKFFHREFVDPLRQKADLVSVEHELKLRRGRPDRSVIDNGEFETLDGWRLETPNGKGMMELDRETFVSGKSSLKVSMSKHVSVVQPIPGRIKPGRRYRLSYFLKTENMVPFNKHGQVYMEFFNGKWQFFPRGGENLGTSDWFHRCYEFIAQEQPKEPAGNPIFRIFFTNCKGTFWVDGLRVEEMR